MSTWVQAWVAPHLYHRVVLRTEFAAYSFLQALASERVPLRRAMVHTLVVPRVRYAPYHFLAVKENGANEAKFEAEGYYQDGPYAKQLHEMIRWLNHPTCRESWQNLLIHQGLLTVSSTCQMPRQLTITGVGEISWVYFGCSNVRRLRFPDYMTSFRQARYMWTLFKSLTHLGMVVYMEPPITRRIVDALLRSPTLERLAVVILPPPSVPSNAARSMGNAIYRELFEVDDERLVVLEEEISLLKMLRQSDDAPFWGRVDRVAKHIKENGKFKPPYFL